MYIMALHAQTDEVETGAPGGVVGAAVVGAGVAAVVVGAGVAA